MLRVNRTSRELKRLPQQAIEDAGYLERADLQQMIVKSPDAFFEEMGERLLLIGEELKPTEFVADRIDLLALDESGAVVVLELKRSFHKLQLLQGLGYAAMISKWTKDQLVQSRATFAKKSGEEAGEEIEQFLLDGIGELNQKQRVVLLAENFEYEVLITAEWLSEHYDVDVACYRMSLSTDEANEFLACTCIYPPPELKEVAIRRGERAAFANAPWKDWESALADVENPAVVQFFREEISRNRQRNLNRRRLVFKIDGSSRFGVSARVEHAYVWQDRRFRNDETFWVEKLGTSANVTPVAGGKALRFLLITAEQFGAFRDAVEHAPMQWEQVGGVEPAEPL